MKSNKLNILFVLTLSISLFSYAQLINFESSLYNSWYKKALDMSIQVWGEVRLLPSVQDQLEQDNTIVFDALIGRLSLVDMYVMHLIDGKSVVAQDDIAYLVHILSLLNHACTKLNFTDQKQKIDLYKEKYTEQIKCMLMVLNTIKKRLEAVLGPEFILSKIEQIGQ